MYGDSIGTTWNDKVTHACKLLETYIKFINKISYTEAELTKARQDSIHFLDSLDSRRNTDWKSVCPEVYTATMPWRELPKLDYA